MLSLTVICLAAAAAAAPASYDQRQEGDLNVRADVSNVLLLVAVPEKLPLSLSFLDGLFKDAGSDHAGRHSDIQDRSDIHVMEAFVEPPTPYKVEIGESTRNLGEESGRAVVIAGRRRNSNVESEANEFKLIGATEQCGPGGRRDPVTLVCQDATEHQHDDIPEEVEQDIKSKPVDKS